MAPRDQEFDDGQHDVQRAGQPLGRVSVEGGGDANVRRRYLLTAHVIGQEVLLQANSLDGRRRRSIRVEVNGSTLRVIRRDLNITFRLRARDLAVSLQYFSDKWIRAAVIAALQYKRRIRVAYDAVE